MPFELSDDPIHNPYHGARIKCESISRYFISHNLNGNKDFVKANIIVAERYEHDDELIKFFIGDYQVAERKVKHLRTLHDIGYPSNEDCFGLEGL